MHNSLRFVAYVWIYPYPAIRYEMEHGTKPYLDHLLLAKDNQHCRTLSRTWWNWRGNLFVKTPWCNHISCTNWPHQSPLSKTSDTRRMYTLGFSRNDNDGRVEEDSSVGSRKTKCRKWLFIRTFNKGHYLFLDWLVKQKLEKNSDSEFQ